MSWQEYLRQNPDVAAHPYFGSSEAAARQHYERHGASEGRVWPTAASASAPAPAPATPQSEYWTASDPRWNDPAQIGKKGAIEGFWDMILPQMGFKGPLTVERKLETPRIHTTENGTWEIDTETVRSPEAQQYIDKLKAAGYDVAMKHPDKRTFKSFYGIITPSGEVKDVALAGSDFGTTLQDMAKTIGPIALAAFGNPAAIGAALGAGTGVAATALGSAVLSGAGTALTGGGLEDILKSAVLGGAGGALAPVAGAVSEGVGGGPLGQVAGQAVSGAAKSGIGALVTGQDPIEAALRGGIASGVTSGVGAMGSEYLEDLPKPLQSAITSAVASEILGGDPERAAINALIKTAPSYVGDVARRPDTGEEGFFEPGGPGYVAPAQTEPVVEPQLPFIPQEVFRPEEFFISEPAPDPAFAPTPEPVFAPVPVEAPPPPPEPASEPVQEPVSEPAPASYVDTDLGPGGVDVREEQVQNYLPFEYETGPGGTDIREEQVQDYLPYIDTGPGPGGTDVREERFGDYVEGDISDPRNYPRSEDNPYGYDPDEPWNQPLPVTAAPAPVSTAPVLAPVTASPAPAPAPAAKSGSNAAAMLAMLASMGFSEDENALAPYQVAQIPVKSPFGLMYGMDQTGPYGMRG